MHLWLQAIFLICSSKKGIGSNQLHRTLGVTLKTAWFMSHRIREAMRDGVLAPMGGAGGIVEADETYIGKASAPYISPKRAGLPFTKGGKSSPYNKRAVVALVERQRRSALVPCRAGRQACRRLHRDQECLAGSAPAHA